MILWDFTHTTLECLYESWNGIEQSFFGKLNCENQQSKKIYWNLSKEELQQKENRFRLNFTANKNIDLENWMIGSTWNLMNSGTIVTSSWWIWFLSFFLYIARISLHCLRLLFFLFFFSLPNHSRSADIKQDFFSVCLHNSGSFPKKIRAQHIFFFLVHFTVENRDTETIKLLET